MFYSCFLMRTEYVRGLYRKFRDLQKFLQKFEMFQNSFFDFFQISTKNSGPLQKFLQIWKFLEEISDIFRSHQNRPKITLVNFSAENWVKSTFEEKKSEILKLKISMQKFLHRPIFFFLNFGLLPIFQPH